MLPDTSRSAVVVLVALAALLALAAPAQAGWRIDRSQDVAAVIYPVPCAAVEIRWGQPPDAGVDAWTRRDVEPCVVNFREGAGFDWPVFCSLMVHEYGHLAGLDHSDNPLSVMRPAGGMHRDEDARGRVSYRGAFAGCFDRGRAFVGLRPAGYGWQ